MEQTTIIEQTPSARRRAKARQELAERILDAAGELFARDGYELVTLRKIAEAVEYSPAAIYTHFADKESLVRELCKRDWWAFEAELEKEARIADPLERIAAFGRAFIRFSIERPNQFRLLFLTPLKADIPLEEQPAFDSYSALRAAVEEGIAAGRFREGLADAELMAQTFMAGVFGAATMTHTCGEVDHIPLRPIAVRGDLIVEALVRGLARNGDRA